MALASPRTRHARIPFARPRSNAVLLAALLVCTLLLATMLAYVAHDAARSHRATAERALQDDAAVAAWELVAGVTSSLQSSVGSALAPVARARATTPYELLPAPAVLAATADNVLRCANPDADSVRYKFRLDFRDPSLAVDRPTSPAMRDWLVDTITAHGRSVYQPDWGYAVIIGGPRGMAPSAIAYAVKYAEHGAPIAAFGFRTCTDAVGESLFRDVAARRALLPASVTAGARNDSVVAILVRDRAGHTIYATTNASPSPYAADVPMEQIGAFTAHAAIRARAVNSLALGNVPGSRVPILAGLLALTAAMVVLSILQLKREHELARLRSDFISSVSHELRTPLSQILLFAETLNLGRVRTEEERRNATDVIVQEGRRLMHLVENILHFSRAERQMTRLGPEPLDLSVAVQDIVDDWTPLASTADVQVRTVLGGDVHALADRSALRQMVLNLLDNALKYGRRGQTVIVGTGSIDRRARVWIEDEGDGIPPRERERVWTPFYRLERHANSAVAGSGIGLYVVRELARLHGGDAWIEDATRAHGGARFVIDLPAAERAAGFTEEHLAVAALERDRLDAELRA
jgi:signal transduction histidine kinase